MSNFFKSTTDFVGNTAQQGLNGVQAGGKFLGNSAQQGVQGVGKGVNSGFNTVTGAFSPGEKKQKEAQLTNETSEIQPSSDSKQPEQSRESETKLSQAQSDEPKHDQGVFEGISGGFKSVGSAFTSGATQVGGGIQSGAGFVGGGIKQGAGFVGDVTKTGLSIGEKVAKTGLDITGSVVVGSVGIAGTAVGGVVNLAAETSGKVFEPVAAGLKSIEGLQGLGEGLEKINGLPMAAVKQVGSWTFKAMNMSGKTPTFFDTDADGVVRVEDTIKGLIVLGLAENNAKYAAYALHSVFSYSTSESWIPSTDTTLPIRVKSMNNTRWGKNWGSYDRIEWCSDMDIETFFDTAGDENLGTVEKWKRTLTKGRQGFGVLLLIFEWGTTWPFFMPPLPAAEIPFKDDIGKVVRTVILPTIFKNWQRSHGIEPNKDSEPIAKKDDDLSRKADPQSADK